MYESTITLATSCSTCVIISTFIYINKRSSRKKEREKNLAILCSIKVWYVPIVLYHSSNTFIYNIPLHNVLFYLYNDVAILLYHSTCIIQPSMPVVPYLYHDVPIHFPVSLIMCPSVIFHLICPVLSIQWFGPIPSYAHDNIVCSTSSSSYSQCYWYQTLTCSSSYYVC